LPPSIPPPAPAKSANSFIILQKSAARFAGRGARNLPGRAAS
jgi:hypothetical protein